MAEKTLIIQNHHKIISLLQRVKTIALIGASANSLRPSFEVMEFLIAHGYQVFPVNPALKDKTIQNIKVYGSLSDITQPIDMVDVFRKSEAVREILDETLNLSIRPLVFWTQIGVYDGDAARIAADNGMHVVMNKCPKIELLQ